MNKDIVNIIIIIYSLIIETSIIRYYLAKKSIPIKKNILFINILKIDWLITAMNLITILIAMLNPSQFSITAHYFTNVIYFSLYEGSFIYISEYILWNCGKRGEWMNSRFARFLPMILSGIAFVIIVNNNSLFYIDEFNEFIFGKNYIYVNVFPFIIMVTSIVVFLKNKYGDVTSRDKNILYAVIVIILGIMSDNIIMDIKFVDFFYCLFIIIIYISVENPEFLISDAVRCYNFLAFEEFVNELIAENKQFYIYGLNIRNFDTIRSRCGTKHFYKALFNCGRWIEDVFPDAYVFYTDNRCFNILSFEKIDKEYYRAFKRETMNKSFSTGDREIYFWTRNIIVDCETDLCSKATDIINGEIYAIENFSYRSNDIKVGNSVYKMIKHERSIHDIIDNAIKEDKVVVYIQPLYNTVSGKIDGGEILSRIKDDEKGIIMPDDYISLTEKSGMIISLGYIIFEKTCKYISENNFDKMGIEFFNINCSPLQFQDLNLADKFKSIADSYGVDFSIFKFEVTESYISDNDIMSIHIENFRKNGATIAMDDFGKGNSNLSRLKELDFDIAKIDMSIVRSYFSGSDAMLKDIVNMLKKEKFKIVAEGVETEEMVKGLIEMGCDYLQGFYFSKPIPLEDFISYLNSFNKSSI